MTRVEIYSNGTNNWIIVVNEEEAHVNCEKSDLKYEAGHIFGLDIDDIKLVF